MHALSICSGKDYAYAVFRIKHATAAAAGVMRDFYAPRRVCSDAPELLQLMALIHLC